MNRVEIKEEAKKTIRGNKWYIWKPILCYLLVYFVLFFIGYTIDYAMGNVTEEVVEIGSYTYTSYQGGIVTSILEIVLGVFGAALAAGYAMYILSFVRGKKSDIKSIINFAKEHWVLAFLVSLVAGLNIIIGSILLIIPGLIASFGLLFYKEVVADNPDLKTKEVLRKAWDITNGHKMDLFVMALSFIGWCIVAGFTFGLLYIWLIPYMTVAFTLAYESLRKNK